jgi:pyruvate dehydrogenase E2 component (dihydrolipoamide acetyltransferase)
MPSVGMTMEEGLVVAWHVEQGDRVAKGQLIVEIESDKTMVEIEATADGVVSALLAEAGAVVPVGTLLATVDDALDVPTQRTKQAAAPAASTALDPTASAAAGAPASFSTDASREPSVAARTGARAIASPRARQLAERLGVDLSRLIGSGPGGSVVERDIHEAVAHTGSGGTASDLATENEGSAGGKDGGVPFTARTLTPMRRRIALRTSESARTIPQFFVAREIDGTALAAAVQAARSGIKADTGADLTVNDLLMWVVARTLVAHPQVNAAFADDAIREWSEINIGMAVALPDGLIVPVIRHVDRLALEALVRARADFVARAREGRLAPQEMQGGTFTVSNLGGFGIDAFNSIVNRGQAAILSVGALRERPVAVHGKVMVRPTIHLSLTVDHRCLDGATAARFLADLQVALAGLTEDALDEHARA